MSRCDPSTIIKTSPLNERTRYRDGDTQDIVTVIMDMDAVSDKYVDAEAAQCLVGADDYDTLRNVWKFVKRNVRYKADSRGKEVVKSPAALFTIGKGDCKSFSITEAALLRALGFKGIRYRFAAYNGGRDVTHVYVVVKSGGQDVILDAVYEEFDAEHRYTWKRDIPAARAHISGIGATRTKSGTSTGCQLSFTKLFAWGLIAWGITR